MSPDVYKRPNKPARVSLDIPERLPERVAAPLPEPLIVDRATECHVTPEAVARRMVGYLGACGDALTLEPSAGTGNLLAALFEAGQSQYETVAIERDFTLCQAIRKREHVNGKYVNPIHECFLEWAESRPAGLFPRIVMNPPFRGIRKHMDAAIRLLGPAGHPEAVLVALVPSTYDHPDMEHLESLGPDTFASAKVHTKIVRLVK